MMNEHPESVNKSKILIVDDDTTFLDDLTLLMKNRYDIDTARTGPEALDAVRKSSFDAVLLDIGLGQGIDGFDVLKLMKAMDADLPIIMVTRDASSASATEAMKSGAVDYIDKKPNIADLERRITRAIEEHKIQRVNRALNRYIDTNTGEMIGESEKMQLLRRSISEVAKVVKPVLITGESGVGKELVARGIHRLFDSDAPFYPFNCAACPRELYDARLFGSEKGAFTGATRRIEGVFEIARDGVVFLDEITEIDSPTQAKLLRVIEEREFRRLGSSRLIRFTGRVLASTNKAVKSALEDKTLRQDIYYRFSTFVINVPPLRERRGDIPLLIEYFLTRKARELKKKRPFMSDEAVARLCAYDWPGNIRELENVIESYVVRNRIVFPDDPSSGPSGGERVDDLIGLDYHEAKKRALDRFQKSFIGAMLAACGGDVSAAAKRMGLSLFGLQKIIKRLGI